MYKFPTNAGGSNQNLQDQIVAQWNGLYDYPNQFSQVPQGALQLAQNIVIERPGVVDSRRGFVRAANTANTTVPVSMTVYDGFIIASCQDSSLQTFPTSSVNANSIGVTASLATVNPPGAYQGSLVRFAEGDNGTLYLVSDTGVRKMTSGNVAPILAGAPLALGGSTTVALPGANNGPLPNNSTVLYRVLWEYTDENNVLVRGVPSNPIMANNSSSSNNGNVSLSITIPSTFSVNTAWNMRVYRGSFGQGFALPDDNMFLVYSVAPNTAQLAARTIAFTDNVLDQNRGEALYTNADIANTAEYAPPLAQDCALYKGCMFYAGTKTRQELELTLQSVTHLSGNTIAFQYTQNNSNIFVITGASSESAATGTFKVFATGNSTVDIDSTAQSICNVVNYYTNNSRVDAFYEGVIGITGVGNMLFQDRAFSDNSFTVVCSSNDPTMWTVPIPVSGTTVNNTSTNNDNPHYLYYSKSLQPEAVPLPNFEVIGSSESPILRIIPMRDLLIVIKSEGFFGVTGNDPTSFAVYPMDVQQSPIGINTAAVVDNYLYCLVSQGVIKFDESGNHQIISIPCQQTIMQYTNENYTNRNSALWGMPDAPSHKYILWMPLNTSDEFANHGYVYDWETSSQVGVPTWTEWLLEYSCGAVDITSQLAYYGGQGFITVERRNYNESDYCDDQFQVNITANANLNQLTLDTFPAGDLTGYAIRQDIFTVAIESSDPFTNTVTISANAQDFTVNTATLFAPIPVEFTTHPLFGSDPTVQKQFSEYSLIVDGTSQAQFDISFINDIQSSQSTQTTTVSIGTTGYGTGSWGGVVWGGGSSQAAPFRFRNYVPAGVQKANWLTVQVNILDSFNKLSFSGLSLVYRPISYRQRS